MFAARGTRKASRSVTVTGSKLQQLSDLLGLKNAKSAKVTYRSGGAAKKKSAKKKGAKKRTAKRK
jgi:hypothetical protein